MPPKTQQQAGGMSARSPPLLSPTTPLHTHLAQLEARTNEPDPNDPSDTCHPFYQSNKHHSPRLDPQLYPVGSHSEEMVECLYTIESHENTVTCVKFSPCGLYFATASQDHTVEIFNLNGQPQYRLMGYHQNGINSLAWSPCSNYLALGCDDGLVSIWNVKQQLPLLSLKRHVHHVITVNWSSHGSMIVSGSVDGSICLFDVETGSLLTQWEAHSDVIRSVSFTSDNTMIVSSSNDGTLRYWDIASGFCLKTVQHGFEISHGQHSLIPHTDFLVAVGCLDGCVRVYDIIQNTCVMLLAGHVNTQYALPITFLHASDPIDAPLFHHDLNNLDQVPAETAVVNSIQQNMLDNMNELNGFIANELGFLDFQQAFDPFATDPTIPTTTNPDQTFTSPLLDSIPPGYLPPTHTLMNELEVITPSGAIIHTTNPIIAPQINTAAISPQRVDFEATDDPTSTTNVEIAIASIVRIHGPFTQTAPHKTENMTTVQVYRPAHFYLGRDDADDGAVATAVGKIDGITPSSSTTTTTSSSPSSTLALSLRPASSINDFTSTPTHSNPNPTPPIENFVITQETVENELNGVDPDQNPEQFVSKLRRGTTDLITPTLLDVGGDPIPHKILPDILEAEFGHPSLPLVVNGNGPNNGEESTAVGGK
jgi:hypothetical protein